MKIKENKLGSRVLARDDRRIFVVKNQDEVKEGLVSRHKGTERTISYRSAVALRKGVAGVLGRTVLMRGMQGSSHELALPLAEEAREIKK